MTEKTHECVCPRGQQDTGNGCQGCPDGFFWTGSGCEIEACPLGEYRNQASLECVKCGDDCIECDQVDGTCFECTNNSFVLDVKEFNCVCPAYTEFDGSECTVPKSECNDMCGWCDAGKCRACKHGSMVFNRDQTGCECFSGYVFDGAMCIPYSSCGKGKYLDYWTEECHDCHYGCEECMDDWGYCSKCAANY